MHFRTPKYAARGTIERNPAHSIRVICRRVGQYRRSPQEIRGRTRRHRDRRCGHRVTVALDCGSFASRDHGQSRHARAGESHVGREFGA